MATPYRGAVTYPPQSGFPANNPPSGTPGQPYAQPYGVQPPVPPYAVQGLALDAKFFPMAWIFFLIKPVVEINGQAVPAQWGVNNIPLPPGQHHVHVHVPYILPSKIGSADLAINVAPQQTVPLEYRAPLWTFSQGSMGPAPQKYNGVGIAIAVMVVPVLIVLLFVVLSIAAAAV